jgi:NAD(P)-dependent dehydrogenase (short-subunit alcohol dehydrogenase family)
MATPYQLTKDNLEMQIGTNHFGHFYLASILFPAIATHPAGGRIINLSSLGHNFPYNGGIIPEFLDPKPDEKKYDTWGAYGQSKLASILFTRELAKRAKEYNPELAEKVLFLAVHPGYVRTELGRNIKVILFLSLLILFCFTR